MVGVLPEMPEQNALMEEVSASIAARRYAVCKECPHMKKWKKTCKVCGCPLLMKVRFVGEACPLGKW